MTTIETTIEVDEQRKATIQLPANMKPGPYRVVVVVESQEPVGRICLCLARPKAQARVPRVPRDIVRESRSSRRAAPCSNSWTRCRQDRGAAHLG